MSKLQVVAAKINWLPYQVTKKNGEEVTRFKKLGYRVILSNSYIVKITNRKTGTLYSIWLPGKLSTGPTGHLIMGQSEPKETNVFKGNEEKFRKDYAHCPAIIACVDQAIENVEAEAAAKRAA